MNDLCGYCGKMLPVEQLTEVATSEGDKLCKKCVDVACEYCGEEEAEHELDNGRYACSSCNEGMFDNAYEEM